VSALRRAVAAIQRRLTALYQLDLDLRADDFLVAPAAALRLLDAPGPRTGLVVVPDAGGLSIGLYVDPEDRGDRGAIVEETSHLVCLAWHAAQERPVSRLVLELQGEVDRYAVARLSGRDGLGHFRDFVFGEWMDDATRTLYGTAHRAAHRYCRSLSRRYPRRGDAPRLVAELRRYYRATPEQKLHAG